MIVQLKPELSSNQRVPYEYTCCSHVSLLCFHAVSKVGVLLTWRWYNKKQFKHAVLWKMFQHYTSKCSWTYNASHGIYLHHGDYQCYSNMINYDLAINWTDSHTQWKISTDIFDSYVRIRMSVYSSYS